MRIRKIKTAPLDHFRLLDIARQKRLKQGIFKKEVNKKNEEEKEQ